MSTRRRRSQREMIYSFIKRRPASGATRKELTTRLGILHQSVGPRVLELISAGLVKQTRNLRNGCHVLVPRARRNK